MASSRFLSYPPHARLKEMVGVYIRGGSRYPPHVRLKVKDNPLWPCFGGYPPHARLKDSYSN